MRESSVTQPEPRSILAVGVQWAARVTSLGLEFALPPLGGVFLDRRWRSGPPGHDPGGGAGVRGGHDARPPDRPRAVGALALAGRSRRLGKCSDAGKLRRLVGNTASACRRRGVAGARGPSSHLGFSDHGSTRPQPDRPRGGPPDPGVPVLESPLRPGDRTAQDRGDPGHAVHGDRAAGGDPGGAGGRAVGAARVAESGQPRLVHEHVRSDAPVHPRPGRPAGDRRARGRPLPALPVDGLLLRPVQQPAGHDPRDGLGHGQHQRDGRAGADDAGHGGHGRDAGDGARSGSGWGSCRTWTCPRLLKLSLWAVDVRHRGGRAVDPTRRAGRASLREHVRRAHRAGGDPGVHPDGAEPGSRLVR